MRQHVGLEVALRQPAPVLLLLDEPWEGLDPDATRWLSDSLVRLSQQGTAIVVSSHRLYDLADVYTRCVFLDQGRLSPEQVVCTDIPAGTPRAAPLFEAFDRLRGRR
jgi:ABC-2 type transport system ATP-binding protein